MIVVIIGILLAILVPGMFKYIDKAKDKIRNDIYGKWKKDNIRWTWLDWLLYHTRFLFIFLC